jgi:large subunit ribosomal protein L9
MKVILNQTIDNLGRLGDVVDVKPGYARNYLFPRQLALQHTAHNMGIMKFKKLKEEKRLELEKLSAEGQKQKIEELTLTITKKAGESDTLFGSVTPAEIHLLLEEKGLDIDKKKFHLDEPIKKLGSHVCKIKLMEDVEADLKIEVVKEGGEPEKEIKETEDEDNQ